jgi:hypothetical protein
MPAQQGYQLDLSFLIASPVNVNGPDSGGTSFFFHFGTNTYLVTAGHVLADGSRELFGEQLKFEIRQDPPELSYYLRATDDVTDVSRYTADLSDDDRIWGFDPEGADVAVIQIDQELSTLPDFFDGNENPDGHLFASFSLTDRQFIGSKQLRTDRVYSLGYPGSLYDTQTRFPVRRNALVASPINFDFGGEKRFLTDARMDPGTSGAPILVEPSQVQHPWGEPVRQFHGAPVLLGIHAGNFPYSDRKPETEEGTESGEGNLRDTSYSDLNETWRPKAITRAIQEADSS